jgi:peptidoglycan hydrolase-like protein with peptidoglycan-binding domain
MSGPIQPFPLVKEGDKNHPVETLQCLLGAHGDTVIVDGIFGVKTDAAARTFQRSRNLVLDGLVGTGTWSALVIQVSVGSTGDAVRGVQEEFQYRNLSGDPIRGVQVDGIFGPLTDAAVRSFQQAVGVVVNGIVGPLTWQALISGMLWL